MSQEPSTNPEVLRLSTETEQLRKGMVNLYMERNRMERDLAAVCAQLKIPRAEYKIPPATPTTPEKVEPIRPPTPLLDAVEVIQPEAA